MCKKAIYLEDAIEEIDKIYGHIKLIREKHPTSPLGEYAMYLDVIEALKSLPFITESEQKRGKWLTSDDIYETGICSICKCDSQEPISYTMTMFKYCPNCGAMMVEEKGEVNGKA